MNEQRIANRLHELAEQGVPADLDLWPAIHSQLAVTGPTRQNHRRPILRLGARRIGARPLVAVSLIAVLLLVGLPATILSAQDLIRGRIPAVVQQRPGVALVDSTAVPPALSPPPTSAKDAVKATRGPVRITPIALSEAQQQVPWPIHLPGWLPPGLTLQGVRVAFNTTATSMPPGPFQTVLLYRPSAEASSLFTIEQTANWYKGRYGFPASAAQDARVNGQSATYVAGVWKGSGQWDPTADVGTLSWQEGEFTYVIQSNDLSLSREDLTRVAESLR
jgi:hypothetical protein